MTTSQNPLGRGPTDDELRSALEKTKWGKTCLTVFLHSAEMNTRITYLNLQGYFEMLEGVGDIFKRSCDAVGCSDLSNFVTLSLLERAYGSYLAAVRLSSSGQLTESYVMFRACIENALYAFNIYSNPKLAKIWIERRKGGESRRESVNLFKPSAIICKLEQINHLLGMKIKTDYEIYIDFGAHPNEMSVAMNLKKNNRKYSLDLLNTTQGRFQMCLSMCVTCGLSAIRVFNLIYPDDFKKINVEQRIQTILEQYWRIAPEVEYKLSTTSP